MTEHTNLGLQEAAVRLGVSVRVLRRAIRAGRIAAPGKVSATTAFTNEWLLATEAAVGADPSLLSRALNQKVPPFARYEGTSAWRKYLSRARDYARFKAEIAA
ncbi:hypothetical protein [Acidocella sp.]|jgi:hypothetical protein|uniref:hypothetical protein n=1 Tax=Acidocella sp. TaxID=50710 RepID=UPI002615B55D|nr:hypothetical protein [Acidocella sp.]